VVEDLPSGLRPVALPPVVEDQAGEPVLILRYVAPEIARARGRYDYDALEADFRALCLRDAPADGPGRVVVALMDRAVPRGQAAPDATQFVEEFRRTRSGCDWEGL
jgi:hypothetical protein